MGDASDLKQALEAALRRVHELEDMLETRKLLEKAKGILMEQQNFTEEMAYRIIQKMSQDQALSMKEICRSLIQVKMALGKSSFRKSL